MDIYFTTELLPHALEMMIMGMAGIFTALFIIYLASVSLQKLFPEKQENN